MQGRKWIEEEEKILEDYYGNQKISFIRSRLRSVRGIDRSYTAIRRKAANIGLEVSQNARPFLTAGDIAECMGYGKSTILRGWKGWGLKIQMVVYANKKTVSKIDVNDFWKFAYENRERIDFSDYQQGSILPEPEWLKEELQKEQRRRNEPLDQYTQTKIISFRKMGMENKEIAKRVGITEEKLATALRALLQSGEIEDRKPKAPFTEKELQLIKKLRQQGKTFREIAEEVGRDERVVSKKVRALKEKGEWEKIGC